MDDKDECINLLRKYSRHTDVLVTNSGNTAIFAALYAAREAGYSEVLIPDQGGWLTYPEYPPMLGMKVTIIRTELGLVKPLDLVNHTKKALLIPSYAGYLARQDLAGISKVCRENGILLIEDASGAVGSGDLCNGNYSDIVLASFGEDKIVDNGHGGFLAGKIDRKVSSLTKPIGLDYRKLKEKLLLAPSRLARLIEMHGVIIKELGELDIIHKHMEGINVAIRYRDDAEKMKILKYCSDMGLQHTLCPREIRVIERAVCIEVKRQRT